MRDISPFVEGSQTHINVVIETPARSRPKYEWDPKLEVMRLKRLLPLGMVFPFDFGFVPGTKADDGDPLDVLLISDTPLLSGALVEARVLGAIELKQSSERELVRNDRLIAVPLESVRGSGWRTLRDLGESLVQEIEGFLQSYVEREGRKFKLLGRVGHKAALDLVKRAS
jgi:inorganic pyrophosphatase